MSLSEFRRLSEFTRLYPSLVYLVTQVLAEICFINFFSCLMNPGGKPKSQNDPVIVGCLIRYNS